MLKINEIFFSIQGESTRTGLPTIFIRLSGCPLRCQYCDTKYAYYEGQFMEEDEILSFITRYKTQYVCITGGEPLIQPAVYHFMRQLCDKNYLVSLETSGARSIAQVDPRVKIILDIKTPGSKEEHRMCWDNLNILPSGSEIKFVICNEADWDWMIQVCENYKLCHRYEILISASFGEISLQWLAEKMLATGFPGRLQPQIHKFIWSPERRGV